MPLLDTACWPSVLAKLREHVGPERYNLWFCNTKLRQLSPQKAEIGVPNKLAADRLKEKYASLIRQTMEQTMGIAPALTFLVDPELFRAMREHQEQEIRDFQARFSFKSFSKPPCCASASLTNLKFKLSNFIVGKCNRIAFEATKSIIANPGKAYNPLFIYGKVGNGKTHLVQGLGMTLMDQHPGHRVLYVSGEEFTNEFVEAVRTRKNARFRERFRSVDTLIIDDIHFIAGKPATQEEFLHTFNAFLDVSDKQIIMASDAHPSNIKNLTNNLSQRFNSGLVTRIDPPDQETCMELMKAFLKGKSVTFSQEAMRYMVTLREWNVRELEGALLTITAYSALNKKKITVLFVKKVLQNFKGDLPASIGAGDILEEVASAYGIAPDDIVSAKRTKETSEARQACMFLTRRLTQMSYKEIGDHFGGRNHATVIAATKKVQQRMASDKKYRLTLENLERNLVK